ncbi:MAG: histidinol-phosphate transaminase, partial [Burkholderiales bacterium]
MRALDPYQPGKPLAELAREYGITEAVKLASNENPLGPGPRARAAIRAGCADIGRYPDGGGYALKKALAAHLACARDRITLGNGSNDVLELAARSFVTSSHQVIFSQHAFAVYALATQAIGAEAVVTPARGYGHDLG